MITVVLRILQYKKFSIHVSRYTFENSHAGSHGGTLQEPTCEELVPPFSPYSFVEVSPFSLNQAVSQRRRSRQKAKSSSRKCNCFPLQPYFLILEPFFSPYFLVEILLLRIDSRLHPFSSLQKIVSMQHNIVASLIASNICRSHLNQEYLLCIKTRGREEVLPCLEC